MGWARRWSGEAGHGAARQGMEVDWHGMAGLGREGRGKARRRIGKAVRVEAGKRKVRQGMETAWRGLSRRGMARPGYGTETAREPQHEDSMTDDIITETDTAEVYPLDVTRLTKGQDIPQPECERIAGVSATHSRYQWELLALRMHIIRESSMFGRPLSVAIRGNSLHVNTDAEASDYHAKLAKEAERSVHRNCHMIRHAVDAGNLTEEQRRVHDRRVAIIAMKSASLRQRTPQIDGGATPALEVAP